MDSISKLGYSQGSPYRNNPFLDIFTPGGMIDMSNTDIPLYAEDETGYGKMLQPFSGLHKFKGKKVRETPIKQAGGLTAAQNDLLRKPRGNQYSDIKSTFANQLPPQSEQAVQADKYGKALQSAHDQLASEQYIGKAPYRTPQRVLQENQMRKDYWTNKNYYTDEQGNPQGPRPLQALSESRFAERASNMIGTMGDMAGAIDGADVAANYAGKAIRSGIDATRTSLNEALYGIPRNTAGTLSKEQMAHLRAVNDIMRDKDLGKPYEQMAQKALNANIPDEHLTGIFGDNRDGLTNNLAQLKNQQAQNMYEMLGTQPAVEEVPNWSHVERMNQRRRAAGLPEYPTGYRSNSNQDELFNEWANQPNNVSSQDYTPDPNRLEAWNRISARQAAERTQVRNYHPFTGEPLQGTTAEREAQYQDAMDNYRNQAEEHALRDGSDFDFDSPEENTYHTLAEAGPTEVRRRIQPQPTNDSWIRQGRRGDDYDVYSTYHTYYANLRDARNKENIIPNIKEAGNTLLQRGSQTLGEKLYPFINPDAPRLYKGEVEHEVPALFMHDVGNKTGVRNQIARATDRFLNVPQGSVVTGSENTSHNSYLTQLKTIMGLPADQARPVFLGYKPMNHAGYLSQANIPNEQIADFINTESGNIMNRTGFKGKIFNPYYDAKYDQVMLPHYGAKKLQLGGNIYKQQGGFPDDNPRGRLTKDVYNMIFGDDDDDGPIVRAQPEAAPEEVDVAETVQAPPIEQVDPALEIAMQDSPALNTNYDESSLDDMSFLDLENDVNDIDPNDETGYGNPYSGKIDEPVMKHATGRAADWVPGKGSIATSHNNPGNIKYGSFAKKYGAVPGRNSTDGGAFALFPDMQTGLNARRDLLTGSTYKDLSVGDAMKKWSNNGYGAELYPEIGGKKIRDLTQAQLDELSRRQIKREDQGTYKMLQDKGYFK